MTTQLSGPSHRTRAASVIVAGCILLSPATAAAQTVDQASPDKTVQATVEQIPQHRQQENDGDKVTIDQSATPSRKASESAQTSQLSRTGEEGAPVAQLSGGKPTAEAGAQLYRGKPTAEPSAPLSTPAQGREQRVVRVEGTDRCDPAKPGEKDNPDCARVIETRAAEFKRPDPLVLSPEQKLLIDQRAREGVTTTRMAVRRIGNNDVDPDDVESQGVASIVLPDNAIPSPVPKKPPEETPAGVDPAVIGIIQAITQQPPSP